MGIRYSVDGMASEPRRRHAYPGASTSPALPARRRLAPGAGGGVPPAALELGLGPRPRGRLALAGAPWPLNGLPGTGGGMYPGRRGGLAGPGSSSELYACSIASCASNRSAKRNVCAADMPVREWARFRGGVAATPWAVRCGSNSELNAAGTQTVPK